jgi:AmmeMemoRadiSam system protein B
MAPVLQMLDGTRTLPQIRQSLLMTQGLDVAADALSDFVQTLRRTGLLDDDAFRERWAAVHSDFLEATTREPTLAGLVYPEQPEPLAALLERTVPGDPVGSARTRADSTVLGVLVPHGPPDTQGSVLDQTLRELPTADALEFVVILGTDHGPGLLPYAATDKAYATPLGSLPVARPLLSALERRVPWACREQVRHRDAVSLELAALHLRHLYGDRCPPVLPVLCGATALTDPGQQDARERFELALGSLCEDRPVLWWLSAELGHAGPAYGRPALSAAHRQSLHERDAALLAALRRADEPTLVRLSTTDHPQGPPSGGATLTAAARLLPPGYRAELVLHTTVPAPGPTPGTIGIAGVRLHQPA